MKIVILLFGSFLAALISGAAGFGGSLLLLPLAAIDRGKDRNSRNAVIEKPITKNMMNSRNAPVFEKP